MTQDELYDWCLERQGRELHVSDWLAVTQERINRFAAATDDYQWIHVDEARAATDSPWKSTIAHGFLTLSLYPYLRGVAGGATWPGVRTVINCGVNHTRFVSAVTVGSQIRLRTTLSSAVAVHGCVQIEEDCVYELAGQAKPACISQVVLRLYV
jgi:acyl dehydratase